MPTSSTGATCGDGIVANEPRAATDSLRVPDDRGYSLGRFLDRDKETVPSYQRPPPGFGKMQCDAEAESEAKTRMRKELCAFEAQFFGKSAASK